MSISSFTELFNLLWNLCGSNLILLVMPQTLPHQMRERLEQFWFHARDLDHPSQHPLHLAYYSNDPLHDTS